MLVLRVARKKTSEFQDISRKFLSLSKKYHLPRKNGRFPLKSSCLLSSNTNSLKVFRHHLHCSAFCNEVIKPSDGEEYSSQHSENENSDAVNCSKEEAEDYCKRNNITVKGKNIPRPITQFSELQLPETLKLLVQENYSEPTPIQAQGWPVAFNGRDIVGVSQTGSGKTLAYMLPAVIHASQTNSKNQESDKSNNRRQSPKVLVLGPTRELVQQILNVSRKFIQACNLKGACVYGGASKSPQLRSLQGAEICVATPGRLLDYLQNREVSLKNCDYLVLDEADRMLDMGFEPQIRDIIDQIPYKRQTLMWSATWPREIRSLAEEFLTDYIHITVGDVDLVANPNIQQNIYVVQEEEKFESFFSLLTNILQNEQSKVLVFAETKRKVDEVTRFLNRKQVVAWGIHGDCSQRQRDTILQQFRRTTPSVLIATDIAARGLDISDIHHVVNYDFPQNIESYIHRIGRTARGSASGESHSFFTEENTNVLRDLISVLQKANQQINPDLLSLSEASSKNYYGSKNSYKPQKRYGFSKPYGRNRMYRRM